MKFCRSNWTPGCGRKGSMTLRLFAFPSVRKFSRNWYISFFWNSPGLGTNVRIEPDFLKKSSVWSWPNSAKNDHKAGFWNICAELCYLAEIGVKKSANAAVTSCKNNINQKVLVIVVRNDVLQSYCRILRSWIYLEGIIQ